MEHMQNPESLVAWLGFFLALIFGYVANKTSFCTMGAVSDVVNMGEWGRMRAWLLAIAVAMLGTNALAYMDYLDMTQTFYTRGTVYWLGALVGGLLFGVGMTLAGGCGQRTLVRLGGGNLKSVVVFMFLGYTALVTMNGILRIPLDSVLRAEIFTLHLDGMQTLPSVLGMRDTVSLLGVAVVLSLLLFAFIFGSKEFRGSRDNMLAGLVVGLVVVAGWYVTGHLGYSENEFMEKTYVGTDSRLAESMTFVGPLAYTMDLWAYWRDKRVTFGVASVFGVIMGSFIYSVFNRSFRWEYFNSPQDMFRHIVGAVLMGFGGITAMGCTIGQAITGVSTLAVSSFIAFFGIVAGAAITMKIQYHLIMRGV
ncbi:MAG TPA: YeeE/YedE family protein [Thiobacillaceae bacterium]|nr:YeeE/YedE family protein [Thiobacillaceae bacterium]HNU64396.1 YeeE/YedE family protein [Thiobacillaceae bacterium]